MNFGFSEEQEMLRDTCRQFLSERAPMQKVREMGEAGRFDRALWGELAELGWTALVIPCLLYTSPSPRDKRQSRMPSSA